MRKAYQVISILIDLFAIMLVSALWQKFGGSFYSLRGLVYFVLLIGPFIAHLLPTIWALWDESKFIIAEKSRLSILAGWIVAAILSRLWYS